MGLFSFLFGTPAPAQALGKPVPPESVPSDENFANIFSIAEAKLIAPTAYNGLNSKMALIVFGPWYIYRFFQLFKKTLI